MKWTRENDYKLEGLIDNYGLETVLHQLGIVCIEKSEWARSAYGDKPLERKWKKRGERLVVMADKIRATEYI